MVAAAYPLANPHFIVLATMSGTWVWYVFMRLERNANKFVPLDPLMESQLTCGAFKAEVPGYTATEFTVARAKATSFGTAEEHTMQHVMSCEMPVVVGVPVVAGGVVTHIGSDMCVVKLFVPMHVLQDAKPPKQLSEAKAPAPATPAPPPSAWAQVSMVLSELRQLRDDWVLRVQGKLEPYVRRKLAASGAFPERQRYKAMLWLLTMDDDLLVRLEHPSILQFVNTQFRKAAVAWLRQSQASSNWDDVDQYLTVLAGDTSSCVLPPVVQACLQRCLERVRGQPQPASRPDLHPLQLQFMAEVNEALECTADRRPASVDNVVSLAMLMALAQWNASPGAMCTKMEGLAQHAPLVSDPQPPGGIPSGASATPGDVSEPDLHDSALERALKEVVRYARTVVVSPTEEVPTVPTVPTAEQLTGDCRNQ